MKTYTFWYGDGSVTAELDERNVLAELRGHPVPPLGDIPRALTEAVEHPVGGPRLDAFARPGQSVCLVVSDMSRFWMRQDLVIPPLVSYLTGRCGIRPEDLVILVANGTHPGGDEKDLRTLVTDEVYDTVRVVNHDCFADDLVYVGTTPHGTPVRIHPAAANADRVVTLGAAVHHVMAGFGGGRKSILPGISGIETIRHNHAFSLDPACFRTNPRIGNG